MEALRQARDHFEELDTILNEWEAEFNTWTANDGGLTMAACDGLDDIEAAMTHAHNPKDMLAWLGDDMAKDDIMAGQLRQWAEEQI